MTSSPQIDGYAAALVEIARAEGDVGDLVDEIYRAANAIDADAELSRTLSDPQIPAGRKQGIVQDLLGPRASRVTVSAVNLVVGAGQGRHLAEIATRMAEIAAAREGSVVAEVRVAVDIDDEQRARLESALSQITGRAVQAKVVVDPTVVGGVVAKIGDRVFDGTVKSRLTGLREQWG